MATVFFVRIGNYEGGVLTLDGQTFPTRSSDWRSYEWQSYNAGGVHRMEGETLSVFCESRATAKDAKFAAHLTPGNSYLVVSAGFNARSAVNSFVTKPEAHTHHFEFGGCARLWEYSDGHGKEYGGLFKITDAKKYCLGFSVPGHHGHGWHRYVVEGPQPPGTMGDERIGSPDLHGYPYVTYHPIPWVIPTV